MVGVSTARGTVLKGRGVRKAENCCCGNQISVLCSSGVGTEASQQTLQRHAIEILPYTEPQNTSTGKGICCQAQV